ncbi:MAG TPA: sigma-70 family RNA polymerase sigma factor [Myxococcota bacterium]|nr:sigma-70 family RNA polymerase sigma factor [Myxococcota bacterium]
MDESRAVLERVFRAESGVVLGALLAELRDLDLAEDAFADAVATALERWPADGVPRRPGAWLLTAARRKALDRLRRRATRLDKQHALELEAELTAHEQEPVEPEDIPDERLRLIFTCCHPALAQPAQVALTLRTLGGLSTAEIARAFLVDESAMARRLVRAKAKLREAGVAYRVPELESLPERREAVLAVLYLIFNEGYAASAGDALVRRELAAEAIRLGRVLAELMPGDAEVRGLLALMLLHDARRDARVDASGAGVPLEEQDRTRWDHAQIAEGRSLAAALGPPEASGPYALQAGIAAHHVAAASFAAIDWRAIAALYGHLLRLQPSPVIELNRAVAIALADGPESGLALLDAPELAESLVSYPPYLMARADLLRRAGRGREAVEAFRAALASAATAPERAYLERRLRELAR